MNRIITAFARNRVFANLLMITVILSGILASFSMIREDMPEMQLDTIVISIAYPGADPEEIEEGVSRKVEEAIDGLEGIDEYTSTSAEGSSSTTISVIDGYDPDTLLDRVRNEIDSINNFPEDSENPSVYIPQIQKGVISLALISEMPEARLKEWADSVKKEIQRLPGVSQVNLSGTRAYEISVEISQATLLKYDLTISDVADIISNSNLNMSGGTLKTGEEEIRLRTIGRKYSGNDLANIKIIKGSKGQTLYLKEIAEIKDGFTENNLSIRANGTPAVLLNILAGEEDTIDIADRVIQYQKETNAALPQGSEILILSDNTEGTRSNLETLVSNAVTGLFLVFILLWLFMDTKISFWVGMGIPVSLLGGLAIVHFAGISLNKITLFGLIMVLGIVADDAIVVGESIFYQRKIGASPLDAVVNGVSEVGMPVLAAVLTTVAAFFPLYHIEGMMGKFIVALPTAVIACLMISLLECAMILPAHLSDLKEPDKKRIDKDEIDGRKGREESGRDQVQHIVGGIDLLASPGKNRKQLNPFRLISQKIGRFHDFTVYSMEWTAEKIYLPVLKLCVFHRYLFLSLCIAGLMLCSGLVMGGVIKFNVFPKQASNIVTASVEFPEGTPFSVTENAVEQLEAAALIAAESVDNVSDRSLVTSTLATIGQSAGETAGHQKSASTNIGGVRVTMLDPEESHVHSDDFVSAWEKATGSISGTQSLDFSASNSGPPGAPIEICIQGENLDHITAAADGIMTRLKTVDGVSQVYSDDAPGKNELKFTLKDEAEYLGVTLSDLASQVYSAFYGKEAVKIQRGNDEVEVNVRLTEQERKSRSSIRDYKIKTDNDQWVPLSTVADMSYAPGYSTITRKDGYRQVKVSAKVNTAKVVAGEVLRPLQGGLFRALESQYPDIRIVLEGDAKRQSESFGSLFIWIPISIVGMFAIIATMFRSYIQPMLVLCTIPFGLVGAVLGHFVMGHMLSLLSVFGMVALTGVVVNDAIVLIERVNMNLEDGMPFFEALFQGGVRRFRAVMLTSISTIGGLTPLILETSQHARQLIPMGISLAFGVAFATILTLILLPCLYTIINDFRYGLAWMAGRREIIRCELEPAFARTETKLKHMTEGV